MKDEKSQSYEVLSKEPCRQRDVCANALSWERACSGEATKYGPVWR